ncbi:MAG: ABC transporter substrate-binding protein [Hymenobacter sp.]|nr:ABC transporter substrate-binding protein [Hymenobacter sp.]
MEKLRLALDWTPTTNHTGFFVARQLGFYAAENLEVDILTPDADDYSVTPAKKLEAGVVDFAVAPLESAISLATKPNKVAAKAIATLLQTDLSAIVTLRQSGLRSPRHLDGKTYASYKARYEDDIVRRMIVNDGGQGTLRITYPAKLGIWDTLLANQADATWIFMNWEGFEAAGRQVELHYFKLADYAIPYSYSPVVLALTDTIHHRREVCRAFVRATKRGFLHARANPEQSSEILAGSVPEKDRRVINILESQLYTAAHYGDETTWGKMALPAVATFIDWLKTNCSETSTLNAADICTNELLT